MQYAEPAEPPPARTSEAYNEWAREYARQQQYAQWLQEQAYQQAREQQTGPTSIGVQDDQKVDPEVYARMHQQDPRMAAAYAQDPRLAAQYGHQPDPRMAYYAPQGPSEKAPAPPYTYQKHAMLNEVARARDNDREPSGPVGSCLACCAGLCCCCCIETELRNAPAAIERQFWEG